MVQGKEHNKPLIFDPIDGDIQQWAPAQVKWFCCMPNHFHPDLFFCIVRVSEIRHIQVPGFWRLNDLVWGAL